jgi:hypothetical protein
MRSSERTTRTRCASESRYPKYRARRFEDVTGLAGPVFDGLDVGRGAAFGDIDNDGDTDIIVGNNNGATRVLLNAIGSRNHWLGLKLVTAKRSGRDMLGRARRGLARRSAHAVAAGARRWKLRFGE